MDFAASEFTAPQPEPQPEPEPTDFIAQTKTTAEPTHTTAQYSGEEQPQTAAQIAAPDSEVIELAQDIARAIIDQPRLQNYNKISALFAHPYLQDFAKRDFISEHVFKSLCCRLLGNTKKDAYMEFDALLEADANTEQTVLDTGLKLSSMWLKLLDKNFNWLDRRLYLESNYPLAAVDYLLSALEDSTSEQQIVASKTHRAVNQLGFFKKQIYLAYRTIAWLVDCLFIIAISGGLGTLLDKALPSHQLVHFLANDWFDFALILCVYIIYFTLLESSARLNTIGKSKMGFRVSDQYGQTLSRAHALWRCLSSLALFSLGIKIIICCNILFFNARTVQDMVSGSHVLLVKHSAAFDD